MKRCLKCLNTDKIKDVKIYNGVCNICLSYEKIEEQILRYDLLHIIFKNLINRYKGNGIYDAVMGISGGKDSTYVLYKLINEYGLNVKAVTFDNGFLSDCAKENIQKVVSILNVDHEYISFSKDYLNKTYKRSIKITGSICMGCSFIMYAALHDYAKSNNIHMMFHGRSRGQMLSRLDMKKEEPFSEIYGKNDSYTNYTNEIFTNFVESKNIPYIGYFMYHLYDENIIKEESNDI